MPGDAENIAGAVERLVAEAERLGGAVPYADMLRLAERKGVTPDQIPELFHALREADVEIDGGPGGAPAAEPDLDADPTVDSMEALERTVSRHGRKRLLTPEEETALTRRIRAGEDAAVRIAEGAADPDGSIEAIVRDGLAARCVMVERNQGLVRSVAKNFGRAVAKLSFDDMVGEGQIGLLKAIKKFDHTRGFKFSTYATWWIFQAIARALADKGSLIRVPVHMHEHLQKYRKARRAFERSEGKEPSAEELAEHLGWPVDRVRLLGLIDRVPVSLDEPVRGQEGMTIGENVASATSGPDQLVEDQELKTQIQGLLSDLPERQEAIIHRRFGLNASQDETLEEIGNDFGVTRERIRQIESKALNHLRHPKRAGVLWPFCNDDGPCPDPRKPDQANDSNGDGGLTRESDGSSADVRPVGQPAPGRRRKRRRSS